jgi:hypothetical protein
VVFTILQKLHMQLPYTSKAQKQLKLGRVTGVYLYLLDRRASAAGKQAVDLHGCHATVFAQQDTTAPPQQKLFLMGC